MGCGCKNKQVPQAEAPQAEAAEEGGHELSGSIPLMLACALGGGAPLGERGGIVLLVAWVPAVRMAATVMVVAGWRWGGAPHADAVPGGAYAASFRLGLGPSNRRNRKRSTGFMACGRGPLAVS